MTLKAIPTPGVPMSAAVQTPGTQLGMPGWSIDIPQGVIYASGTPIKLVPAIVSALALKLIFFTGAKVSAKGKSLLARKQASTPLTMALANNPRRKRRSRRR